MRRGAVAFAFAVVATAAWAETPLPFASGAETRSLSSDERRVWSEADDFDRVLRRANYLYQDRAVEAYLQRLADQLYPDLVGTIRVRLANDPMMNAFALPNGSLYINVGLVARMENEAQLAAVMGHEGAHFVYRHSYRQRDNLKGSATAAMVLSVLGGGLAGVAGSSLAQLAVVSSVFGYSRDLEREADHVGFERMAKAGYDAKEGARSFELLDEEAKVLEVKEPLVFATHPKLQERIDSWKELAAAQKLDGGKTEADSFTERTAKLRSDWLQLELSRGKYKSLIYLLSKPERAARYSSAADYYLGEAYRLRGEPEDDQRSESAYHRAMQRDPTFAPTYRALGIVYYKRKQETLAREYLGKYLELAPDAKDAGYVKSYLQSLEPTAPAKPASATEGKS